MRAPDHRHTGVDQRPDHPGRLRIVQQHHVAFGDAPYELRGTARGVALVDRPLGLAQRRPVVGSVQVVVQVLGDAEEAGVAADDDPARVQSRAADVADQRSQHLGDAAAARRRVHRPQRVVGQQLLPARDRLLEPREAVGRQHVVEPAGRQRGDGDVREPRCSVHDREVGTKGGRIGNGGRDGPAGLSRSGGAVSAHRARGPRVPRRRSRRHRPAGALRAARDPSRAPGRHRRS